ncbi:unnamed protein product [marine sediment metagenome]|uniref:Uncharacterized protein n=1 Tax=marine sediment metagenome TaxID=412755 RepID=X0TY06_9ZZZZ
MATTNLIVDFLVVGASALWWIAPILLATSGTAWLRLLLAADLGALPLLLGAIYLAGLVVSRIADDLLKPWNDSWRDDVFHSTPDYTYHNRVNAIIATSESASEYLGYRRSVLRTARACALNTALASLAWLASVWAAPIALSLSLCFVVGSALATCALLRTWKVVVRGYFMTVRDMSDGIAKKASK